MGGFGLAVGHQIDMFPEGTPSAALRYWDAVKRWYDSGTNLPPTQIELAKKFSPPMSQRGLQHIRERHADLVGRWPPRRTDRAPWDSPSQNGHTPPAEVFNVVADEPLHKLREIIVPGVDDCGQPVLVRQFFDTLTGRLIDSRVDLHTAIAAAVGGIAVLADMAADGRLDHTIRLVRTFCRV